MVMRHDFAMHLKQHAKPSEALPQAPLSQQTGAADLDVQMGDDNKPSSE